MNCRIHEYVKMLRLSFDDDIVDNIEKALSNYHQWLLKQPNAKTENKNVTVDNDIRARNLYNEILFLIHDADDAKTIMVHVDADNSAYYSGGLVGLVTLLNAIRITNSPMGMTQHADHIVFVWTLSYKLLPYLIEKFDGDPKHILCHLKREQYAAERRDLTNDIHGSMAKVRQGFQPNQKV